MSEQTLLSDIVARLIRSFPTVPPAVVAEVVNELHVKFDGARLRDYVPLFVERNARTALAELAVWDDPAPPVTESVS